MTATNRRPWSDPFTVGSALHPERYALQASGERHYLGIAAGNELIERVSDPAQAWTFHTHERAVAAAREIAAVYGLPVDVVRLQ